MYSHSTTTWKRRCLWVAGHTRQVPWRRSLSMNSGKIQSWAPSSHLGLWSPQRWLIACPQTSTCSATTSPPWVFWVRLETFPYLLFKGSIILTYVCFISQYLVTFTCFIYNYVPYIFYSLFPSLHLVGRRYLKYFNKFCLQGSSCSYLRSCVVERRYLKCIPLWQSVPTGIQEDNVFMHTQPPDKQKIWLAARCSGAAPTYFRWVSPPSLPLEYIFSYFLNKDSFTRLTIDLYYQFSL